MAAVGRGTIIAQVDRQAGIAVRRLKEIALPVAVFPTTATPAAPL